jgi:hypothetical protein
VDLAKTRFSNINNQTVPRKPNNGFDPRSGLSPLNLNHVLDPNLPNSPSASSFGGHCFVNAQTSLFPPARVKKFSNNMREINHLRRNPFRIRVAPASRGFGWASRPAMAYAKFWFDLVRLGLIWFDLV